MFDVPHSKKRRRVVSKTPHPTAHTKSLEWRICCLSRLSRVGSLLRRRRHTKKDTFAGICLCQTSSTRLLSTWPLELVIKRQDSRTEYPWIWSNIHLRVSVTLTYKTMLCNNTEHSLTLSSSQANKRCLHTHALPPSPHPSLSIFSTEKSLFTNQRVEETWITKATPQPNDWTKIR